MLKLTDSQQTKVVHIPIELAQSVGVFKDMIESPAVEGLEPVYQANAIKH
jgi:hypothetical protein